MADLMTRTANQTVVAVVEIGIEDVSDMRNSLDDAGVAWWLAQDHHLENMETLIKQDPLWTCPICSEGPDAENENGWVVRICGDDTAEGKARSSSEESTMVPESEVDDGMVTNMSPSSMSSPSWNTADKVEEQGRLDIATVVKELNGEAPKRSSKAHVFHEGCLRRWLLKNNSCPVCRQSPVVPESVAPPQW
jgi:hypothetical protein